MKAILFLAALMPLGVLAQPININNNPNQPGYVVPSQQRMQNEMKVQQQQQQSMLKQDLNNQTRSQQQHLQNQLQTNQQRAAQGGNLNPPQQVLPNIQLSYGNIFKIYSILVLNLLNVNRLCPKGGRYNIFLGGDCSIQLSYGNNCINNFITMLSLCQYFVW